MTTVLCTLYNSLYLDKGLVLYDSLCECAKDFKLYVLCMDDKCYEVLKDLNQENHIPIKLSDFEDNDKELLQTKAKRSFGEYCWTCTPSIIKYVIEKYNEPICTYIDADMYFYQDPELLVNEMRKAGKSVMIIPHRFSRLNKHFESNGVYCVEFNTFINESKSQEVLKKWRQDCLECCSAKNDGLHFGDQKYLDRWPVVYPDVVHVCQNVGAGVAPWNIEWYKGCSNKYSVYFNNDNCTIPIIFYHFQHITYISRESVKTSIKRDLKSIDYHLVDYLYIDYLRKIEQKKAMLETKYKIQYLMKTHPAEVIEKRKGWRSWLKGFDIVMSVLRLTFPEKYNEEYVVCF